ncbi:hypothetical protein TEQG_06713 [Trichophyton equinum CBS 127.97]|uniref:Uncharacterized protein n=1 Tax=Trichophyton equinum (strain ATCC MYA-4606 / CBS 127.97) TaxID=559882 RepID=F2Q0R2_TRIEC|nr:hypothetical protein TEQG_06713 [Trichophyton equinum CBS 127.97]
MSQFNIRLPYGEFPGLFYQEETPDWLPLWPPMAYAGGVVFRVPMQNNNTSRNSVPRQWVQRASLRQRSKGGSSPWLVCGQGWNGYSIASKTIKTTYAVFRTRLVFEAVD